MLPLMRWSSGGGVGWRERCRRWARAGATPGRCPRPEHAGSRVRFDGRYGPAGHRRQRYRCVPGNGDRSAPLHRAAAARGVLDRCLRVVRARGRLPRGAARRAQLSVRRARDRRGAGDGRCRSTYREAALVSRERAKRLRVDPVGGEPRFSRHGSLVMDWVEVFAPVVFEPYRPRAWPASGSLLLDELPFRVRDPESGRTGSRSGSSPRWGMRAGARSCGVWRRSRASPRPTGRRSSAPWTGRRRGSCATTTTASRMPCAPASRRPSCTCASGICATRWSG